MPSGTKGAIASFPTRMIAAVPLGTLLIGSTLVASAPSAAADDSPVVILAPRTVVIEAGATATMKLKVRPSDQRTVCLFGAEADNGFFVGDLKATAPAEAEVTGEPEKSVPVTTTVTYAFADSADACDGVTEDDRETVESEPLQVIVLPEEEPPPTTPPPTPAPTPTPSPTRSSPDTPAPTSTGPSKPGKPEKPEKPEKSEQPEKPAPTSSTGDRSGDGPSDRGPEHGSGQQPRPSPQENRSAPSDSTGGDGSPEGDGSADQDWPPLPTDAPDLPSATLPSSDDLADLPTVEPGKGKGAKDTTMAADDVGGHASIAPVVLLFFLLLLLLLSAPLPPARRVRTGTWWYRGRRRRS